MSRITVVGGGVAGLSAALAAVRQGHEVRLVEAGQLGGKLRSSPFAGIASVDEGPDAFLARLPWATGLARSVGVELTSPRSGSAWVWWERMHEIPSGLLLGVPTLSRSMVTTRLLSPMAKGRAATEALRRRSLLDDDSLGSWVRRRFGNQVHERLVDPLVGSIYAADTDRFSLAAVTQLAELAAGPRSVLLGSRSRPTPPPGPVFYAPAAGMSSFVDALRRELLAGGADLRCGEALSEIRPDGDGWRVDDHVADGVVLACPAPAAARLLADVAEQSATLIGAIPTADVAIVTLAISANTWPERCRGKSGYLVPKPKQRLVTAVSFGSQKWAEWDDGETVILRVSLGRDGLRVLHLGDEVLIAAAVDEVGEHLGVDLQPTEVRITRWPGAFPQYRPHHAARIAQAESTLPASLALAGASYHGIGIPMCVRSGEGAVARVTGTLER